MPPDSKTEISDLLRKCRILASRLGTVDFKNWVDYELNGYPEDAELPDYRIVPGAAVGWFSGAFGSAINRVPLPSMVLDEKHRDFGERVFLRGPIGSYSDLVKQASRGKGGGHLSSEWPANLVMLYAQNFYEGYALMKAQQHISASDIVGVIESVRNKILAFTLDLETETPEIKGEMEKPLEPSAQAKASQVFHTHIYGNVGNVATGSTGFSQAAVLQVSKGDFGSLKEALARLGVPGADVQELELAVQKDGDVKGQIGSNSSRWLGKMMEKAASGAWNIALSTAGTMLPKLLSSYFGLPS